MRTVAISGAAQSTLAPAADNTRTMNLYEAPCQSSSPWEASTLPTTSAIKTGQNILASLHATQMPLTQPVVLQAPLSPWNSLGLPLAPGLLISEAGYMQQLYLQQHHHALQQNLHTLMPPYTHPSGQTQTMMLQNQVR